MSKIVLSMDGLVLKEFSLNKERMTIGRKPHNDIQIDNLAVSGDHAVIITMQDDAFIEDLGSTNGTLVNGQPISKHFLQDEDRIELGKYRLKYVKELQMPSKHGEGGFEKTMILRPGSSQVLAKEQLSRPGSILDSTPDSTSASVQPSSPVVLMSGTMSPARTNAPRVPESSVGEAALQVLSGRSAGRELNLTKMLTTVGKAGVQVAVITRRPRGYFITHVEGDSFPFVNGMRLDQQAHALADQDVIDIAGVKMSFFLKR
jgi:pSer/pThr/pTyr-binding forkhead associated (FHA) protein